MNPIIEMTKSVNQTSISRITTIISLNYIKISMDVILTILKFLEHNCIWCGIDLRKITIYHICSSCQLLKKKLSMYKIKESRGKAIRKLDTLTTKQRYYEVAVHFTGSISDHYSFKKINILKTKYGHARFSKILLTCFNILRAAHDVYKVVRTLERIDAFLTKNNVIQRLDNDGICHRKYCDQCGGNRRVYNNMVIINPLEDD